MATPKPTTHAREGCTLGPNIKISLNFPHFGRLLNEARLQHGISRYFGDRRPLIQAAEKYYLQEFLNYQLEDAFDVLAIRMTCFLCQEIHIAPEAMAKWDELVVKIDEADVEDVTEEVFEEWLGAMYEIEYVYQEETNASYGMENK